MVINLFVVIFCGVYGCNWKSVCGCGANFTWRQPYDHSNVDAGAYAYVSLADTCRDCFALITTREKCILIDETRKRSLEKNVLAQSYLHQLSMSKVGYSFMVGLEMCCGKYVRCMGMLICVCR